jgi:hypothetical protein
MAGVAGFTALKRGVNENHGRDGPAKDREWYLVDAETVESCGGGRGELNDPLAGKTWFRTPEDL